MSTLFARLSAALLVIILLVGSSFYLIELFSTRMFYEELTQRLNGSIAMYVTGERDLIQNGEVKTDALELLAQQAMIINPTVEVYLLDTQGRILGHAFPPDTVKLEFIDLSPVHKLLAGGVELPLKGNDPRNPGKYKIFSAAEVIHEGALEGYLYTILGGQKYDELASSIRSSYVRKLSLGAILAIVITGFLVGLLVFGLLTRRLTVLTRSVQRFTATGFDPNFKLDHQQTGSPAADEIGQLSTAFGVMADKIHEQFDNLKETDRLRRELISNVSHDLRTPLASMHGYVDTLLIKNDTLSTDERKHYLEITRRHTHRLGQLIGDLFELSKLDSASITPNLETFSLAELLQDVTQDFELEASKAGITMEIKAVNNPAMVYADIGLMQRVLENLIRNALKFTPRDGRITISMDPTPEHVSVAVSDTGCGITDEDIEHIFDRFYHADKSQDSDSTGLGLAIVKRILDLHDSRITVQSSPNEGTRFEFMLQRQKSA